MRTIHTGLLPEALLIDLPEVDAQHEEIFIRLETLKDACFDTGAKSFDEFECLLDLFAQHFATEEKIASQAGLEFSGHRQTHHENLHGFGKALDEVRKGARDVYCFLRYVEFWFERHIIQDDKPFALSLQLLEQSPREYARREILTLSTDRP